MSHVSKEVEDLVIKRSRDERIELKSQERTTRMPENVESKWQAKKEGSQAHHARRVVLDAKPRNLRSAMGIL